jgi:FkbH-like protein
MKGFITDLDDTLWRGIVGDDAVDNIHWGLEHHALGHALYQGMLASLADIGVLIGIASKNDLELVQLAFQRTDLLLSSSASFPIEVNWQPKVDSVARILQTWNIHPEAKCHPMTSRNCSSGNSANIFSEGCPLYEERQAAAEPPRLRYPPQWGAELS